MLGRLIDTVSLLEQRDIGFRSLQEQIDTTTSGGKLVFHVFEALAEFSSTWSRERPQAGFTAARPGRPKAVALPSHSCRP